MSLRVRQILSALAIVAVLAALPWAWSAGHRKTAATVAGQDSLNLFLDEFLSAQSSGHALDASQLVSGYGVRLRTGATARILVRASGFCIWLSEPGVTKPGKPEIVGGSPFHPGCSGYIPAGTLVGRGESEQAVATG